MKRLHYNKSDCRRSEKNQLWIEKFTLLCGVKICLAAMVYLVFRVKGSSLEHLYMLLGLNTSGFRTYQLRTFQPQVLKISWLKGLELKVQGWSLWLRSPGVKYPPTCIAMQTWFVEHWSNKMALHPRISRFSPFDNHSPQDHANGVDNLKKQNMYLKVRQ